MNNNFSNNLKKLRLQRGWTQEELGKKIKKDYSTIGKWENGSRSPIMEDVIALAKIFDIGITDLISTDSVEEYNGKQAIIDKALYNDFHSIKELPEDQQQAVAEMISHFIDIVKKTNK